MIYFDQQLLLLSEMEGLDITEEELDENYFEDFILQLTKYITSHQEFIEAVGEDNIHKIEFYVYTNGRVPYQLGKTCVDVIMIGIWNSDFQLEYHTDEYDADDLPNYHIYRGLKRAQKIISYTLMNHNNTVPLNMFDEYGINTTRPIHIMKINDEIQQADISKIMYYNKNYKKILSSDYKPQESLEKIVLKILEDFIYEED